MNRAPPVLLDLSVSDDDDALGTRPALRRTVTGQSSGAPPTPAAPSALPPRALALRPELTTIKKRGEHLPAEHVEQVAQFGPAQLAAQQQQMQQQQMQQRQQEQHIQLAPEQRMQRAQMEQQLRQHAEQRAEQRLQLQAQQQLLQQQAAEHVEQVVAQVTPAQLAQHMQHMQQQMTLEQQIQTLEQRVRRVQVEAQLQRKQIEQQLLLNVQQTQQQQMQQLLQQQMQQLLQQQMQQLLQQQEMLPPPLRRHVQLELEQQQLLLHFLQKRMFELPLHQQLQQQELLVKQQQQLLVKQTNLLHHHQQRQHQQETDQGPPAQVVFAAPEDHAAPAAHVAPAAARSEPAAHIAREVGCKARSGAQILRLVPKPLADTGSNVVTVRVEDRPVDGSAVLSEALLLGAQPYQQGHPGPVERLASPYRGVSFHPGKQRWHSRIWCGSKSKHLGYFMSDLEAARAYIDAARKIHGDNAKLHDGVELCLGGSPDAVSTVLDTTKMPQHQQEPDQGRPPAQPEVVFEDHAAPEAPAAARSVPAAPAAHTAPAAAPALYAAPAPSAAPWRRPSTGPAPPLPVLAPGTLAPGTLAQCEGEWIALLPPPPICGSFDRKIFKGLYQRNNKGGGLKNLRCFPSCGLRHQESGFCGRSVQVEVYHLSGLSTGTSGFRTWVEFVRRNDSPSFAPGEHVPLQRLQQMERSKEEPVKPLVRGERLDDKCTDTVSAFEFNKERRGWHYGWASSKHTKNDEHALQCYVFQPTADPNQMLCRLVFQSPTFMLFSRRRHRFTLVPSAPCATPRSRRKKDEGDEEVGDDEDEGDDEEEGDDDDDEEEEEEEEEAGPPAKPKVEPNAKAASNAKVAAGAAGELQDSVEDEDDTSDAAEDDDDHDDEEAGHDDADAVEDAAASASPSSSGKLRSNGAPTALPGKELAKRFSQVSELGSRLTQMPKRNSNSSSTEGEQENMDGRTTVDRSVAQKPRHWTDDEDELLRNVVELHGEENWKKIAESVPGRNHAQCRQRWSNVLVPGLKKGVWEPREDEILVQQAQKQLRECLEQGKTAKIECVKFKNVIPGRTAEQCRERWVNHLNPEISREPWTRIEDETILRLYQEMPQKWAAIAKHIHRRTGYAVKIRYKTLSRPDYKPEYPDERVGHDAQMHFQRQQYMLEKQQRVLLQQHQQQMLLQQHQQHEHPEMLMQQQLQLEPEVAAAAGKATAKTKAVTVKRERPDSGAGSPAPPSKRAAGNGHGPSPVQPTADHDHFEPASEEQDEPVAPVPLERRISQIGTPTSKRTDSPACLESAQDADEEIAEQWEQMQQDGWNREAVSGAPGVYNYFRHVTPRDEYA
jgi:hypothetical protein